MTEEHITRRRFLTYLLGFAGALGLGGLVGPFARYAYPVQREIAQPKQRVASASSLQPLGEAVEFDYLDRPSALIVLADGTPKAFYLACTHFGCIVTWRPDEEIFYCPCHAGEFAADGTVVAGPPPSPLVELHVVQEGDDLFVDGAVYMNIARKVFQFLDRRYRIRSPLEYQLNKRIPSH